VFPMRYEQGVRIAEDDILHSLRRELQSQLVKVAVCKYNPAP
jgi:hypothetical protein